MSNDSPGTASVVASATDRAEALDGSTYGRWLVTTQGSTHIWDISSDGVLYRRNPGAASAGFVADGTDVTPTRIDRWPAVGSTSFIWFDDPAAPEFVEQWRQSSTIRSITRLSSAPFYEEAR